MDKHILGSATLRALASEASFATFGEAAISAATVFAGEAAATTFAGEAGESESKARHPCMQRGI